MAVFLKKLDNILIVFERAKPHLNLCKNYINIYTKGYPT